MLRKAVVAGSGWLWLALVGSGWLRPVLGGSGWLWVIPPFSNADSKQEEDDKDSSIDQVSVAGNDDSTMTTEPNEPVLETPREAQHASKRKPDRKLKSSKLRKLSSLDDKQIHLIEEMEKDLMRDRALDAPAKSKDSVDAFCESLALEIKQFNEQERCLIKHEINNIIFKHQMNKFNLQAGFSSPPSSYSGRVTQLPNQSFQMSQFNDYAYNG